MTRAEAEKIMLNHHEVDDDTGERITFDIVSYEGTDGANHLFRCKEAGTQNVDIDELPVYEVIDENTIVVLPT